MSGSVALTWTAPTTGTPPFTYQVHYSTDQVNWTPFGSPIQATSAIVTGLQDGTTYYFQVDAINLGGTSPWSNTVSEMTAVATGVPGAPTGLTPSSSTTSTISLSWSAPTTGTGPFTYQVRFSTNQQTWTPFGSPSSGTSVTVTGLTAATTYYFEVAATNAAGTGPYTAAVSTATSSATPALTSVVPTSGTTTGGTLLTLAGTNLSTVTGVTIGGSSVAFTIVSNTQITITAPAHAAGAASITATGPGGTSSAVTFTYTATVSGAAPTWTSVTPWVVQPAAGQTITLNGSGFTGASVIDPGSGQPIPATVVSDSQITFAKPATGASYYPYEFYVQNSYGNSSRFGLITGLGSATTTIDDPVATTVASSPMTVFGYTYPVGAVTNLDVKRYSDNVNVDNHVFTPTNSDGSWSITFNAPTNGQYFLHANTATSGTDFWTGAFTTVGSLSAPFVTSVNPFAKVPGLSAPIVITGSGFTGATAVNFGSVSVANHTVVNDGKITLPSAPDQAFGAVNMTVTGASGQTSNAASFQYLHALVEPVPQSVGGAAPVVSSRWKGPWAAVNAPKSGQVTSITVDPVHGNSAGTGSDGTSNNLWSTFDFLSPSFGPSSNYPLLADGGTIHIRAGTFAPGANARGHSADFPGGINVIGVGADQVILNNYGFGPGSDKAMSIWHCNTYIYGIDFRMNGIDEGTSGYGAIRFYNDTGTAGSATAHYMHVEKCRFNQCEEAIVSDTGWTTTGENWCLYIKDCDFSPLIQDCYNTDILSHEVYSGAQQFWENCNSYGPKYGTTHKGRSPSMTIVGCWTRRTLNRWIDYPESGVFQAWNSTFTESAPQSAESDGGDTDMHVFEYCSTTPNLTVAPSSPLFNKCDIWFSRGVDISTGGTQGEDWMTPIAINFVGCRAHWSNVNGAAPKIFAVDPADFSTHNERIVGIPLSNPGTTWETLPTPPAFRTP